MAHLTPAERRAFPYADHMPADLVQRLSRAEVCDRLVYSSERDRVAKRAAPPGQQREIIQDIIAMMRAQPRAATTREVDARISKSASVPDAFQGLALRRSAHQLLTEQPPAPRNPDAELIVKGMAKEDGLMICYDANGVPFGVCGVDALQPVTTSTDGIAAVAKAQAMRRRPGRGR